MAIIDNNNSNFRPLDWDNLRIPYDPSNTITGINTATAGTVSYNLPGALINYTMDYDMDTLIGSGMKQDEMESMFKKQLAEELAKKMVADGHIVFTKQRDEASHKMRYRSYTWVGTKDFIEQQRKNKR